MIVIRTTLIFLFQLSLLNAPPLKAQTGQNHPAQMTMELLHHHFNAERAMKHVEFFTQFWRVGGGPGYDSCIAYIEKELRSENFSNAPNTDPSSARYEVLEDIPSQDVWHPEDAVLSLEVPEQRILSSYAETPLLLCINSFPTDLSAPLVFVSGGSQEADFEQVNVAGKIVLTDEPPQAVFPLAMQRGAVGVISSHVPPHNRPSEYPHLVAQGRIPIDTTRKSFALKISSLLARELKEMLAYQEVRVRVKIGSFFSRSPIKTLVAEIPGAQTPKERIILVAHLDHYKPGANDNASGSATLLEIATTLQRLLREQSLSRPSRTVTFLWVDEYRGTEFWMRRHRSDLSAVHAVFVLDMVGGNPEKTGGLFRVERMPDPAVIWMRPPDQHSGWGTGRWEKEKLFGSYLNDFFLSVVRLRQTQTHWRTTDNVWEGGSDHDPFLRNGIPALLSWHFPDFAYHASLDGIENLSPDEMKNAGVSIGSAAMTLALGTEAAAKSILEIVYTASVRRLDLLNEMATMEVTEAQVHGEENLRSVRKQEKEILDAWGMWYEQAIRSVLKIPAGGSSKTFEELVESRIAAHRRKIQEMSISLGL
jgi:hypothetical protein